MNIREPEKQVIDDFEHRVTNKINKYGDLPDFPKLADYGIERMELEDYLFDKQAILDMGGSARAQLTTGGIITLLPVLVLSAFPDHSPIYVYGKMWTTVLAILLGLMIALFFKALLKLVISIRLSSNKDPKLESYIKAVLFYEPSEK